MFNVDQVSYTFCKDFISVILKDLSYRPTEFGRTKILIKTFHRVSSSVMDLFEMTTSAVLFHS